MKDLYENMVVKNERIKSLTSDILKGLWQQMDAKIDETMQEIWDSYPENLWAKLSNKIQDFIYQDYIIKINLNLPEELSDVSKVYQSYIFGFLQKLSVVGLTYKNKISIENEEDKSVIGYLKFNLIGIMSYGKTMEQLPSLTKWAKKFAERYNADMNKIETLNIDIKNVKIDELLDIIFNALSNKMMDLFAFNSLKWNTKINGEFVVIEYINAYPKVHKELSEVLKNTPIRLEDDGCYTRVVVNSEELAKFYYDMLQKSEYEQEDVPRTREIPKK